MKAYNIFVHVCAKKSTLKGKSEDVALPRGLQDKGAEGARHLAHREPIATHKKYLKYNFDHFFTLVLISMMKKCYASVYFRH
jgi:hypothetical protein